MRATISMLCFVALCHFTAHSQLKKVPGTLEKHAIVQPVRDSLVNKMEKVAFLMVVNFKHSNFRWMGGYRKFVRKYQIGADHKIMSVTDLQPYKYYFSNKKTPVENDIVDVKVLKQ